ncbi:hypothetical protein [Marinicella gelatinilytica]|uniref:hypothetical protein n=1 Tax=Marinicella gelatinilytica TaxID=2996017 RepID=UPI0022608930|nr:hypothetical protein [Marinicella gelatinilytica]MCX7544110.1 hypothetical protein [Marinicella gelatinilytica]
MKQLADELGILPLRHKHSVLTQKPSTKQPETATQAKPDKPHKKDVLNKEELRLLVKILKAIGHTCEHQNIKIIDGITRYQLNDITLIFDDVNTADTSTERHLSPLSHMLKDPEQKRPTWEKLKNLKD